MSRDVEARPLGFREESLKRRAADAEGAGLDASAIIGKKRAAEMRITHRA